MNERFVSPCPPPNDVEREILTTLIEEAAEVIQRATKMLRFGIEEVQPGQLDGNNRFRLSLEIGDLLAMIKIATEAGLTDWKGIAEGELRKRKRFEKYRQFRPEAI